MARHASVIAMSFSCIGHATMHVLTALYLTIVIGLETAWAMPYDELIRLWAFGALLVGLGAPLAGWLGDRWSEVGMMVVFFLLTGAGAIWAGLADGATTLWVGLAVLGLGASIYHPVGMSWLVRNAARRGRAMGVLGIFGSVGIALAAAIAAGLIALFDWRAAFIIPGAASVALGLSLAFCWAAGLVSDRQGDVVPEKPVGRGDAVRAFILLSVTMAAGAMIFQSVLTSMPRWFEARLSGLTGDSLVGVGLLVTTVYLLASGAQILGGWLADRFSMKRVYVGGMIIQAPLLLLAAQLFDLPLLIAAAMVVFIGSFLIPAENLMLARFTPARHRGLAYGAKFILAFGVAPLAINLVAWSYGQPGGFTLLITILAGFGVVSLIAALQLPATRPTPDQPEPHPAAVPAE